MDETQWEWLEDIFKNTNDNVYLIGSGIQIMMNNRIVNAERWPDDDKKRLTSLIEKH